MSGAFCCIAMATIKLKNSQVKGKAPLAADLDVGGELAVNHHADDPGLFLKDTAGNVRKIAGVGSISTVDATEAAKGVVELATAAETTTGTDATRAVHPAGLKVELDKLKLWSLNGTKLTAQESGGTKRGASLDFASCLPNGASHILTDNNTHFIAEYRHTAGQAISDLTLIETDVHTINVTGIDTLIAIGGSAFQFKAGGASPVFVVLAVKKAGVAVESVFQAITGASTICANYQASATVHLSTAALDPTATYAVTLSAKKEIALGPISSVEPSLTLFGLKIKA